MGVRSLACLSAAKPAHLLARSLACLSAAEPAHLLARPLACISVAKPAHLLAHPLACLSVAKPAHLLARLLACLPGAVAIRHFMDSSCCSRVSASVLPTTPPVLQCRQHGRPRHRPLLQGTALGRCYRARPGQT